MSERGYEYVTTYNNLSRPSGDWVVGKRGRGIHLSPLRLGFRIGTVIVHKGIRHTARPDESPIDRDRWDADKPRAGPNTRDAR